MRSAFALASATLALLAVSCGGLSSPAASSSPHGAAAACVDAGAPHHAYVVVQHQGGGTVQRCVGFSGDSIGGDQLMKRSGIEYQTQTTSFGPAVCQIDNEPAQFTECLPKDQPYWGLWVVAGGAWKSSDVGFAQVQVHDREALGWHYVSPTDPSPSPPPAPAAG